MDRGSCRIGLCNDDIAKGQRMAGTKRKSGRSPGSKNTNTKGTAKRTASKGTSRASGSAGRTVAAAEPGKINSRVRDEIVSIIIIAVGVFLIVAFQTHAAGEVGTGLSQFFKGCFGFAAYILPYYFIVYGLLLFSKKTIHVGWKSAALLLVIFFMITFINAGRYLNPDVLRLAFGDTAMHYNNGIVLDGGGVFGMILGGWIVKLIGIAGLYILSVVVIVICLLLLMNTPVSRFFEKAKESKAHRTELREARAEERRQEQLAYEQARAEAQAYEKLPPQPTQNVYHDSYGGAGNFEPAVERRPGIVTDKHRKILGYIAREDFAEEPLENLTYAEQAQRAGQLDFSLGEKAEKKSEKKKRKQTAEPAVSVPKKKAEKEPEPEPGISEEARAKIHEPIIIGGFSPKETEAKLTKAEVEKNALKAEDFNVQNAGAEYEFPPIDLLHAANPDAGHFDNEMTLRQKAMKLEETLRSFNISAQVTNVTQGPAVTRYEVHPSSGVKVSGIKNLADDIALNMEAKSIRIEAPIPGKPAVGIEIENERINMVTIREILDSREFRNAKSKITFAVGKDIAGKAIVADLKSMPHLLIAGSTGSGKSVCINGIITSLLYKASPDEVKLVLIDPKVVELSNYDGIPHMLIPVVTEPAKAAAALNWAVAEMDDRYRKFAAEGARELASYNRIVTERGEEELKMPQVVIIIDELADLIMAAKSQVEDSICRLAQKARAAGMHLIVATQRPSVDVITGVIKANIPSRIAFAVSSQPDSRTILDMVGAEKLVGKGDMLFNPLGSGKPVRVQGAFISDEEVHDVIEFVKSQVEETEYSENVMDSIERANIAPAEKGDRDLEDELLPDAIELVVEAKQASVSMLQRRFRIGYNRAARIIDMMEDRQIIGPADGSRPRQVLISESELRMMDESVKDLDIE